MKLDKVPRKDAIGKTELHRRLRQFVTDSAADPATDPNIGPAEMVGGNLGVTPWVHVVDGDDTYCLHADVRRSAVVQYLKLVDTLGETIEWTPVLNARGKKANAVAYGPQQVRITPFYMYLLPRPKRASR